MLYQLRLKTPLSLLSTQVAHHKFFVHCWLQKKVRLSCIVLGPFLLWGCWVEQEGGARESWVSSSEVREKIIYVCTPHTLYTSRKPLQHLLAAGVPSCEEPGSAHEQTCKISREELPNLFKQRRDELRERNFFVSLTLWWRLLISVDSCAEWGWPDTLGTIQGAQSQMSDCFPKTWKYFIFTISILIFCCSGGVFWWMTIL